MKTIIPNEISVRDLQRTLQSAIAPRPIAFASTINNKGEVNLAPFSFFNVFSANPPILVFSPARSGRTGKTKDTYDNVKEVPEVNIGVVNYKMVHKMSVASSPFEKGVNEFIKAGFTEKNADLIKPPLILESPVNMECKVIEIKELGQSGGAGNLIICEVLKIHIKKEILDQEGNIDQSKIDLVARLGKNWYSRTNENALFEIPKPISTISVGYDSLPELVKNNTILSENDLGFLASAEEFPSQNMVNQAATCSTKDELLQELKQLISQKELNQAWAILLKNKDNF